MTIKEHTTDEPYQILRFGTCTQLQSAVVKYMSWGYSLYGKTFQDNLGWWVQVVTKIK